MEFLDEETADNFCISLGTHVVILGNYKPIKSINPTIIAHINKVLLPWNEFFINVYWNNSSMQVMICSGIELHLKPIFVHCFLSLLDGCGWAMKNKPKFCN